MQLYWKIPKVSFKNFVVGYIIHTLKSIALKYLKNTECKPLDI